MKELADQITQDYAGKSPLIVGTLRGSFVFMADLVRQINLPLTVDFLSCLLLWLRDGKLRPGKAEAGPGPTTFPGRDVLIIEDIVDSGNTLSKLLPELQKRGPASLKVCALLDKPERRVLPFQAITWASPSPTPLWWAMGWTLTSTIASCPTSVS